MVKEKKLSTPELALMPRHKGLLFILGFILLILGIVGLSMEFMLTLISMYFFAALLIVASLSHFADAFHHKGVKGVLWQVLIAVLYLFAAFVVVYDPLLASTLLTALIAWVLVIIGISRIIMAFSIKNTSGWGWLFFAGICSFILGLLILLQWPISGLWVIGMFIAIDLIIIGWTYIVMAFALRS